MRTTRGFSLIELVLVILVTAILGAMVAYGLVTGVTAWRTGSERLEAHGQIRFAMERMIRELRVVRHDGTRYEFLARTANSVQFHKQEGTLLHTVALGVTAGTLEIAYDGGAAQPLARGVTSFRLDWLQADGVTPATSDADVAFVEITLGLTDAGGRTYLQVGRAGLRRRG